MQGCFLRLHHSLTELVLTASSPETHQIIQLCEIKTKQMSSVFYIAIDHLHRQFSLIVAVVFLSAAFKPNTISANTLKPVEGKAQVCLTPLYGIVGSRRLSRK